MRVAGVDEAGRGPLAGPVVAAAVVLPEDHGIVGITDSKRLSPRRRLQLAVEIRRYALGWAVAEASHEEIDHLNILQATLLAMQRAVAGLEIEVDRVEVDGNRTPQLQQPVVAVVKGDARVEAIAAASILAKVDRDEKMMALHARHPHYRFDAHKGYPTPLHLQLLQQYGPLPEHRRSFRPVARLLQQRLPEEG